MRCRVLVATSFSGVTAARNWTSARRLVSSSRDGSAADLFVANELN